MVGYGFRIITGSGASLFLILRVAAWNAVIVGLWAFAAAVGVMSAWRLLHG